MFCLRDGLLPWGPEWPRRSKTRKTRCFSLLFMQKSRKLCGFAHFFVPPATTSPGSLGPRMGPMLQKPRKLDAFHYFLCKNNENSMVLPTFLCPWRRPRQARRAPARILIGRRTVRLGPRLIPLRLATATVEHPVIAAPALKPTWARHAETMPVMVRPTTREGGRRPVRYNHLAPRPADH